MFEQSLLIDHPSNKSWSVAASLSGQVLLVTVAIGVPLLLNQAVPRVHWATVVNAPAPLPPPVPVPQNQLTQRTMPSLARTGVFAPPRVPPTIAMIVDHSPVVSAPPSVAGVPFSTGGDMAVSNLIDSLIAKPAPPPAQPMARKADKPDAPLLQGGRVQAAKLIKQVIPQYPALAKQARISGTVRLQGFISKDGTIKDLQLISGHPLLVPAAIEAVRQWIYKPTLLNGVAVEVVAPIDVVFTLSQ